jgi:putative FmdB family regulatory protein
MPLYDYVCYECGNTFEKLRRMNDDDREVRCPECGSERIERMISTFSTGGCGSSSSGRFR